jgi:hypothetical protein
VKRVVAEKPGKLAVSRQSGARPGRAIALPRGISLRNSLWPYHHIRDTCFVNFEVTSTAMHRFDQPTCHGIRL